MSVVYITYSGKVSVMGAILVSVFSIIVGAAVAVLQFPLWVLGALSSAIL